MPIKPENRARYPKDWPAIRKRILKRAGNRCETCRAKNHTVIARGLRKDAGTYMTMTGRIRDAETGKNLGWGRGSEYDAEKFTRIVLTIAHLDHTPENCADDNLRALCQMHHLRYDLEHHQRNARATRQARKAAERRAVGGDLFEAQA